MLAPRVYVETSIPSAYCTSRTDAESAVRKNWTQHWWDFEREGYDVFTSEIVIEELERGDYPTKQGALSLVECIPLLAFEPAITEIVKTYIRHFLMPARPGGDAAHLALASYHKDRRINKCRKIVLITLRRDVCVGKNTTVIDSPALSVTFS